MVLKQKSGLIAAGLLAAILVLFCYFFYVYLVDGQPSPGYPDNRQVTCSFTIRNKTARVITDGRLWVYAPVRQTSFQKYLAIDATLPFTRVETPLGNQILEFDITDLPPYAVRIVQVTVTLSVTAVPGTMEINRDFDFLSPESFMESDHPDIISAAQQLKGRDDLSTAENIFTFVSSHIYDIGYIENVRGAHYALIHKKGDCTEHATLYTALCRASQIPARSMGGYICKGNCFLNASGYHNWAEVFINGAWRIVDCQKRVFLQNESDYMAFQIISDQEPSAIPLFERFQYEGDGLHVTMNN